MKLKELRLCFENLEVYILKPNMFKYFYIQGLKEDIFINSYQFKNGETERMKVCDKLELEINAEGLKQKGTLETEKELKQRLACNDITSVDLIYDDNTEESIYVPWSESQDHINDLQQNIFDGDKIHIKIKR